MNNSFKTLSLLASVVFVAPMIAIAPGDVIGTIGGEITCVEANNVVGTIGGPVIKIKDTATMKAVIEYLGNIKEGDVIGTIGGPMVQIENIAVIKVLINCLQAKLNNVDNVESK